MHLFNAVGFVAVVTIGCSDDASSTRGAGGGTNSGGVATSRGGAAPGSSGAEQGGHVQTGGVAGQGGASGSTLAGGSTTVAGGTSGSGTTDVSGCPQWPRASVLPLVGPFFYGPDPGPCGTTSTSMSGTESTIYEYQGALILSSVTSTRTRNYTWSGGLLAGYTESPDSNSNGRYVWSATAVTDVTSSGSTVEYVLATNGYPLEAWLTTNATATPFLAVRYEYRDCRLIRRTQLTSTGAVNSANSSTFEYDANGRIVSQLYGSGMETTFDYSCW